MHGTLAAGITFSDKIIFVKTNLRWNEASSITMRTMSEPNIDHALAADVDWLLNRVWLGFGEARAQALEPLDLTVREHVLMRVLRSTDATQLELASITRVDKSVLTTTIDSLERKGYVVRRVDDKDRRAKRPQLTPQGIAVCIEADRVSAQTQARLLELVAPGIRDEFVGALRELALGPFAATVSFSQSAERPKRTQKHRDGEL